MVGLLFLLAFLAGVVFVIAGVAAILGVPFQPRPGEVPVEYLDVKVSRDDGWMLVFLGVAIMLGLPFLLGLFTPPLP